MDDAWPVEPDDAIEEPLDDPIELDGIAVVEPVGAAQVHVQGVEPIEAVDPIDPIETSGLVAPVPSVGIVYGATVDGILVWVQSKITKLKMLIEKANPVNSMLLNTSKNAGFNRTNCESTSLTLVKHTWKLAPWMSATNKLSACVSWERSAVVKLFFVLWIEEFICFTNGQFLFAGVNNFGVCCCW